MADIVAVVITNPNQPVKAVTVPDPQTIAAVELPSSTDIEIRAVTVPEEVTVAAVSVPADQVVAFTAISEIGPPGASGYSGYSGGGGGGSFLSANVARVDPSGNDGTGIVGDLNKPFLTCQSAIDAFEAISVTDPAVIEIGSNSFTENLTTDLYNLTFSSSSSLYTANAFQSITFTEDTDAVSLHLIGVSAGTIAASTPGGISLDFYASTVSNSTVNSAGAINLFGNANSAASGTISCTGGYIAINGCLLPATTLDANGGGIYLTNIICTFGDGSGVQDVPVITDAASDVFAINSYIDSVTAAGILTLIDSRVQGTNNASSTVYADRKLEGIGPGGLTGQIQAKASNADFDVTWIDPTAGTSGYSGFSGATGSTGTSGFSGYSGFCGATGSTGSIGTSGFSGYSGFSSVSGYSGYSGFCGTAGVTGASGFSGYSGYSGPSGYSGYSGFCGLSGYSGFCGATGSSTSGFSGYSGFCGTTGLTGTSGFSGYSGFCGTAGSVGTSGFSGYSGFCGATGAGTSGFSGYSGFCGTTGGVGTSGFSGYSGFCGATGAGTSGFSGYSGFCGTAGGTGTSGFSGYSGFSGFSGPSLLVFSTQTDTDYTLVAGDANTGVKMSSSTAHTLTVPLNATVPFATGTQITIEQGGTGIVTIAATGGVTLQGASFTSGQYSVLVLVKQATDTWLVASGPAISKILVTQNVDLGLVAGTVVSKAGTVTGTAGVGSSLFLERLLIPSQMTLTEIQCAMSIGFPATNQGAGTMSRSMILYSIGNSTSLASYVSASGTSAWGTGTSTAGASGSLTQFQGGWSSPLIQPMTFASSSIAPGEYVIGQLFNFAQASSTWTLAFYGAAAASTFLASAATNLTSATLGALSSGGLASVSARTASASVAAISNSVTLAINNYELSSNTFAGSAASAIATATAISTKTFSIQARTIFSGAIVAANAMSTGGFSAGSFIGTSGSLGAVTNVALGALNSSTLAQLTLPNFGFIGTGSTTSGFPTVFINGIMSTGGLPAAITLTSTAVTYSGSFAFQQPWFALVGS